MHHLANTTVDAPSGCLDPYMLNYDPNAIIDDGSCQPPLTEDLCLSAYSQGFSPNYGTAEEEIPNYPDPSVFSYDTDDLGNVLYQGGQPFFFHPTVNPMSPYIRAEDVQHDGNNDGNLDTWNEVPSAEETMQDVYRGTSSGIPGGLTPRIITDLCYLPNEPYLDLLE